MSIWSSFEVIGDHGDGSVRDIFDGSNQYPDRSLSADIDLAEIPSHCVPDSKGTKWSERVGPWLRISTSACDLMVASEVALNESAVTKLRDALTDWLDRPKVHPISEERS